MNSREAVLFLIDAQAHIIARSTYADLRKDSNPDKKALQSLAFTQEAVLQAAVREKVAELLNCKPEEVLADMKAAVSVFEPEPVKSTSMPIPLTQVGTDDGVAA